MTILNDHPKHLGGVGQSEGLMFKKNEIGFSRLLERAPRHLSADTTVCQI